MRNSLFTDMGTDVYAAFDAAVGSINRLPKGDQLHMLVALHVLTNTVANAIIANEMGEVK
jgi:hypothetical protein